MGIELGEFVEAGDIGGYSYYVQRDSEGRKPMYLYFEDNCWQVSETLGNRNNYIKNCQNTRLPPKRNWEYIKNDGWTNDDTSLTLTFTTLSPCKMVRVTGRGDAAEEPTKSLGDYRSVNITTAISQSASGTNSFVFWIHPTSYFSCGPG